MGGSYYSRLWQPGTQDVFSSKNSKRCAIVETCLWYFSVQVSWAASKMKKRGYGQAVKKDTPQGSVPGVYFPPYVGLLTYTTHTGVGTMGESSTSGL